MNVTTPRPSFASVWRRILLFVGAASLLLPPPSAAQESTGSLTVIVQDETGGAIRDALVTISSPVLIGGPRTRTTKPEEQSRFLALPPGDYRLEIEKSGFPTFVREGIYIGAGDRIEVPVVLKIKFSDSIRVDAEGSRAEHTLGRDELDAIPVRRASFLDLVKTAPAISPTSPGGISPLVSAAGSGVDQQQFRIDGMNVTAPTNGGARMRDCSSFR